jgi:hypothetical protein
MKQLQVPFIAEGEFDGDMAKASAILNRGIQHAVDHLLWSDAADKPVVTFSIAYTAHSILLKYRVKEKYFKADYHNTNDPVFNDSCVELFIAFDNDINYYNFEFNALGTALVEYGSDKNARLGVKTQLIQAITSKHHINTGTGEQGSFTHWELLLNIPFTVFEHHYITTLQGRVCSANFYKCGDGLPVPHFLSWNNIIYPKPNFHLPKFFGRLKFVS